MLLALLLVSYQRSQEDEKTRTIEFVLDVQLPASLKDRELMTRLPPTLKVTVQGSSGALDALAESTPSVELDLRAGQMQRIHFRKDQFEVPARVTLGAIDPSTLELEWQDIITRHISVQPSRVERDGERSNLLGLFWRYSWGSSRFPLPHGS